MSKEVDGLARDIAINGDVFTVNLLFQSVTDNAEATAIIRKTTFISSLAPTNTAVAYIASTMAAIFAAVDTVARIECQAKLPRIPRLYKFLEK